MRENPLDISAERGFTEDLLCGTPVGLFLSRGRQAQERSSPDPTRRKGLDQSLFFIPAFANARSRGKYTAPQLVRLTEWSHPIMSVSFWSLPGVLRTGVAVLFFAVLMLTPMAPADAADGPEQPSGFGSVATSGLGPLPPTGTVINVETAAHDVSFRPDSLHQQARAAAVDALEAWGYRTTDRGTPVLRVGVSTAPGPVRTFESPVGARPNMRPGEIAPIPDSARVPVVEPQVRVPLGARQRRLTGSYTVTLMLFERGREPVWSATSSASGTIPEPEALVRTLTRTAMSDLGRSVGREFTVSCDDDAVARGAVCPE